MKFYRCNICGNIVGLVKDGGGTLVCCGEPMEELAAKTEDEGKEKHVPVVEREGNVVKVKIGSIPHPMEEKHYIEWIAIKFNNKVTRAKLKYTDQPEVTFIVDEGAEEIEVYEYCNIHGLWKTTHK